MKRLKISVLILVALLITTSCGSPQIDNSSEIVVTDQIGRIIKLDAPAERIVSSYYPATSILLALGLHNNIVGIEAGADTRKLYSLAAPEIINLPSVNSGNGINIEEASALRPDMVILPKRLSDSVVAFEELGIAAVVINPETLDGFLNCVSILGKLTGREETAEKLEKYYNDKINEINKLTKVVEKPRVYFAAGSSYLSTCTGGMYQADMIKTAGGICVSENLSGGSFAAIDREQLIAWNPRYIFVANYAEYDINDIKRDKALSQIEAILKRDINIFPSEIEAWDSPSSSSILGFLYLTNKLHPTLLSKEDYIKEVERFYREFFGIIISTKGL